MVDLRSSADGQITHPPQDRSVPHYFIEVSL